MAVYNIHAGHNWHVPGASGVFAETKEDRIVKDKVIALLRREGHTVYDCTDEDGRTVSQNLSNIVRKCNAHASNLDVSIHFNAFNGTAHGVEVLQYNSGTQAISERILNNIVNLGFTRRGVKDGSWLYVCSRTKAPALLVECCFCDSPVDAKIYNSDKMALAIAEGILGKKISGAPTTPAPQPAPSKPAASNNGEMYRIRKSWGDVKSQLGAYRNLDNAKAQCPVGYSVFNNAGQVVFSNNPQPENLYRVRKSWSDVRSQIGAYKSLDNAKNNCPSGYTVFDTNGNAVFSNAAPTTPTPNTDLYRVRLTWEDAKSQKGAYRDLNNAKATCDEFVGYSVFDGNGKVVYKSTKVESKPVENKPVQEEKKEEPVVKPSTPAEDISPLKGMDKQAFIEYVGNAAKQDMLKSGVLASVSTAQAILESAYGQSELSLKANNLFGMKSNLSGNTWKSEWDGKIYSKKTKEEERDGQIITINADFRAYPNPDASIVDHSNYLLGAKRGSELRYNGLKGEKDYRKAIQIIKDGGYATDSRYVDKVCKIIEDYNLTTFDYAAGPSEEKPFVEQPKKEEVVETVDEETKNLFNQILSMLKELLETILKVFKKK